MLNDILNIPGAIKYQPGEVCCEASGRRKNDKRTSPLVKQQRGCRADGIVKSSTKRYELVIMEAVKIENGPQGTKAMTDTAKLGKMMKDYLRGQCTPSRPCGKRTSEVLTVMTPLLAFQRQIKALVRTDSDLTRAKFKLHKTKG
ncbi:hypothetical protein BGZ98_001810 [Dissophora globulifera]|nr:hypothetical protein BGZ98_001810 [Dissophora globulifera]